MWTQPSNSKVCGFKNIIKHLLRLTWFLLTVTAAYLHPAPGTIQGVMPCAQSTIKGYQSQRDPGVSASSVSTSQHGDGSVDNCSLPVVGEVARKLTLRFVHRRLIRECSPEHHLWGRMRNVGQRPQSALQGTLMSGRPSELSYLEGTVGSKPLNSPTDLSLDTDTWGWGRGTWPWWPGERGSAESRQPSRARGMSVSV